MRNQMGTDENQSIRAAVRQRYTQAAGAPSPVESEASDDPCCAGSCGGDGAVALDAVAVLYDDPEVGALPADVTDLSLGCGDPVTLAALQPGQTVLDLGSGGGIDCFLAARKVGPTGHVIGVDMTPAMIERARANRVKVGADNVEFRLGEIEHLPVETATVDVILSNCVINLSTEKPQVLREAFRVLKPGGRLAVSDIVTDGPLPSAVKQSMSAWAGCVAGALEAEVFVTELQAAGFVDVELEPLYWEQEMVDAAVSQLDPESAALVRKAVESPDGGPGALRRAVFSAKIRARKPER